jgi:phage gp36-like protein
VILYAAVSELREANNGTDAGTGTLSQLSDTQLTLALQAASNRVSVYAGTAYDINAVPPQVPPDIFHDLTLDLAAFWAAKTYLKNQNIGPTHPVWLAYTEAMKLLESVRKGEIDLSVGAPGSGGASASAARVINRIPGIFTYADSNTRVGNIGILEADTPPEDGGRPGILPGDWGQDF